MELNEFTKRKILKESLNNFLYLCFGVMSNLLVLYTCMYIDSLINSFDDPHLHLLFIPSILSIIAIFLEYKFINDSTFVSGYFIAGNVLGMIPVLTKSLAIPNNMNLNEVDSIIYNLIRFFTPVVVYMTCNSILYMILKVKYMIDIYNCRVQAELQLKIEEMNKQYEEDLKNGKIKQEDEKEEKKDAITKSRSFIEKVSDSIAKNIDPEYERTEHISDIDIDKVLEQREIERKNKKEQKKNKKKR